MKSKSKRGKNESNSRSWLRHTLRRSNRNFSSGSLLQENFSPRQIIRGALATSYHIPEVSFNPDRAIAVSLSFSLIAFVIIWKFAEGLSPGVKVALLFTGLPLLLRLATWVLSCFDKPFHAHPNALKDLRVVVSVPTYNEAPETVDACLFALVNQTRPPDLIDFVDDGSHKVDYSQLKAYWAGVHGKTTVNWRRKVNEGKRRAHAATFREELAKYDNPQLYKNIIFVTVDSDTILAINAIEEGIQRFADPKVMSVGGTELGYNYNRNLLTLIQCCLQEYAQVVISAAWSVSGDMFTNRGPFSLIRASAFAKIIDVYANEIFLGRRVELADDSLTALAGSMCGKSVQQISAVGFTMWPEKLSHHSRQRTRWARGRTVRNFWRLKYYPITSYIWWFTALSIYSTIIGLALLLIIIGNWPQSVTESWHIIFSAALLGWVSQMRTLALHRSDEKATTRFFIIALRPIASLWSAIVLTRIIRAYGTVTFLKQGWTTRQNGVENTMLPKEASS